MPEPLTIQERADETLAMLRALVSVWLDDYENEPPDFSVKDDDGFGFGEEEVGDA